MKDNNIRCPYCDWEYLPGEIYLPNHFLGQPKDVTRTSDGKIDLYDGLEQSLEETFTCLNCNKNFKIKANITYETIKNNKLNMSEDYETQKYKDRITLKED